MWEAKENKSGYDLRKANDICNINHTKLYGAMEVGGAIDMFNRSVDKNNLIYHECLGDSDTSSFKKSSRYKSYEKYDIIPSKLE